jgi:hypothetical protein
MYSHIWLRGSACQCSKGHNAFLWETSNFSTMQNKYPLTDRHQIWNISLRQQVDPMGQSRCFWVAQWRPLTWVKYYVSHPFYFFFWFLGSRRGRTVERRTDRLNGSNDAVWRKEVSFGVLISMQKV